MVAAEGAEDAGIVGTMVAGNDGLDYAVIQFDPQKVAPVNDVNGFRIDGLGPDPTFGEVACKLGRTTGYSCGVTWGPGEQPGTIVNQVCGQPGDSGAPVTVNNRLVGMIHGAFSEELPTCVVKFIPLHTPAVTMSINTHARRHHRRRTGPAAASSRCRSRLSVAYLLARIASNTLGIHQRRGVAEFAALGDVAQQPAHDLAAAGLRQLRARRGSRVAWRSGRSPWPPRRAVRRPCLLARPLAAWP